MIELPESMTLANQIKATLTGKTVMNVYANKSPHKFAWFRGNPDDYNELLSGKNIIGAASYGGMVEVYVGDMRLIFCDGTNIRYYAPGEELPIKHQLQIEFDDFSSLICSVQMYGALCLLEKDQSERYNECAKSKINPLSNEFDENYFNSLYTKDDSKLSVKAFLATKQRIPGLGNGVLQDILFNAKIHPKRKINSLSDAEYRNIFRSIKDTLLNMTVKGGRDTEKDIFGCPGSYKTILSSKTLSMPCPVCGGSIIKEAYLGGNIYFCSVCQRTEGCVNNLEV